tara:strand:- start:2575 stop:2865 length:291 start_codon:yes stop_codon:yes gene_type:complete
VGKKGNFLYLFRSSFKRILSAFTKTLLRRPRTHFTKENVHHHHNNNNSNKHGFVDRIFDALKSALKDRRSRGTDETEIEKSGTFLNASSFFLHIGV